MSTAINTGELNEIELAIYNQFNGLLTGAGYVGCYKTPPREFPYFLYSLSTPKYQHTVTINYEAQLLTVIIKREKTPAKRNIILLAASWLLAIILVPFLILMTLSPKPMKWLLGLKIARPDSFTIQQAAQIITPGYIPPHTFTAHTYRQVIDNNSNYIAQHLMPIIKGEYWPKGLKRVPLGR